MSGSARIIAGAVKSGTPGRATVAGKVVTYSRASSEPQVDAMVVGFDSEYSGDIPGTDTLRRGSVANFRKTKVEMIDPRIMRLRLKDKHEFRSDILVVDIVGGEQLPSRKGENKLRIPGEILVFNSSGQLEVHSEIQESREFFYNTFEKPEFEPLGGGADGGFGGAPQRGAEGD